MRRPMSSPSGSRMTGSGGRDLLRQVGAGHRRLGHHPLARLGLGQLAGEHAAAHRALVADVAHQRAGVDAGERRDAAVRQPGEPAALGVRRVLAVDALAHDHRAGVHGVGLHVVGRHAVVADQRVGEDDDLAAVAGVGDRLLVAGHRGVEDDLAGGGDRRAGGLAVEAGAVLEQQVGAHLISPWTVLNSGPPASPSSSNRAVSTLVTTAPARAHPVEPELAVLLGAGGDRVARHVHLDARGRAGRARSATRTRGSRCRRSAPGRARRGRSRRRGRPRTRSSRPARRRRGARPPRARWRPAPSGTAR